MMTRLKVLSLFLLHVIITDKYIEGGRPTKGKTSTGCGSNDPRLTEDDYSERGHDFSTRGEHREAFDCYSRAIDRNPHILKYYTNRAFCAYRLGEYKHVISDCKIALDMDQWDVKANFFLGSAYLELEEFNDAVKFLQTSFTSAQENLLSFGDDIASQLRAARRKKWRAREEERLAAENKLGLFPYLKQLMREDEQRKIDEVRKERELSEDQKNEKIREIEQKYKEDIKDLTAILSRADERTKRRELPDYLCGRMNYKLLHDAVITPKGDTYEREDIENHLEKFTSFDPLNPEITITKDDLVPNLAINDAAVAFLNENDWIQEFEEYVTYVPDVMEE